MAAGLWPEERSTFQEAFSGAPAAVDMVAVFRTLEAAGLAVWDGGKGYWSPAPGREREMGRLAHIKKE